MTAAESTSPSGRDTYGGQVIGRALRDGGVEHVFGVYGSISLAIEEANRRGVQMLHFRHEQSAAFAADAYARSLRRPGVCFTSSAPGFTNVVSAIAQAKGALSPVVLLNGQHGVTGDGLDTIQEGYAAEMLRSVAKWTHRCLDWNLHEHWVRRSLTESVQWAPGPVVLEFPRNAINVRGPDRQQKVVAPSQAASGSRPFGDPVAVEHAVRLLLDAERPVLIAGDGVYWSDGMAALREAATALRIPVQSRRTARGALPETHELAFTGGYRGRLLREADVVCIVGVRATYLEEWFEPPEWRRDATYIQVHETPSDVWPGLPTEVAIVGACGPVLSQFAAAAAEHGSSPPERSAWLAALGSARASFKERQREQIERHREQRPLHPHLLGQAITEVLDERSTVIFDSFTATGFLTDKLEAAYAGQILDAGLHQPVGHGIGMAIGAQVARPGRQVLALMGDGGFGISAMDMDTLVRYGLPAVIVVMNNDSWSRVAAGHDSFYPEMGSWNNLPGLRYDRMFKELGCHGEHVEEPEDLRPALDRAFASGKPAVVNVVGDTLDVHPLRLRICAGDTWTRGNVDLLPESGREQLRKNGSPQTLWRIHKYWLDNGLDIPFADLAALAGVPAEDLVDYRE